MKIKKLDITYNRWNKDNKSAIPAIMPKKHKKKRIINHGKH